VAVIPDGTPVASTYVMTVTVAATRRNAARKSSGRSLPLTFSLPGFRWACWAAPYTTPASAMFAKWHRLIMLGIEPTNRLPAQPTDCLKPALIVRRATAFAGPCAPRCARACDRQFPPHLDPAGSGHRRWRQILRRFQVSDRELTVRYTGAS
jgi:hypothetical protein